MFNIFGYTLGKKNKKSGDFFNLFFSLLAIEKFQNHFIFSRLIFKIFFGQNLASKKKKKKDVWYGLCKILEHGPGIWIIYLFIYLFIYFHTRLLEECFFLFPQFCEVGGVTNFLTKGPTQIWLFGQKIPERFSGAFATPFSQNRISTVYIPEP
jgi:hypothetical protein